MGIFFTKEDKGKYFLIRRRKFTLALSFLPIILFFLAIPFTFNRYGVKLAFGLLIFTFIFGMWMAIEGIYYYDILLKRYKKQGKKIERTFNTKIGTKVYK